MREMRQIQQDTIIQTDMLIAYLKFLWNISAIGMTLKIYAIIALQARYPI